MKKQQIIQALRKMKHWTVIPDGNKIKLVREFGKKYAKAICLSLTVKREGLFLEHPNYVFVSRVSHFKSLQDDVRLSLNKVYLSSTIKMLKEAKVWPYVENKKFIVVNNNNKKSNKSKVSFELTQLLTAR